MTDFTYLCGFCERKFSNKEYYEYLHHLRVHHESRLSELLIQKETTILTATNGLDKQQFQKVDNNK